MAMVPQAKAGSRWWRHDGLAVMPRMATLPIMSDASAARAMMPPAEAESRRRWRHAGLAARAMAPLAEAAARRWTNDAMVALPDAVREQSVQSSQVQPSQAKSSPVQSS
jgi:hypothetical protein